MAHPRGQLTGSKRTQPKTPRVPKTSKLKQTAEKIADTTKAVGETAKAVTTAVGTVANSLGDIAESIGILGTGHTRQEIKSHDAYGGLQLATFNPDGYLASDLFTDSSNLTRTSKAVADEIVSSVEEKRQTLRVVAANLELNTDALKVGVKSEKMTQSAIDYGTSKVGTETKLTQFQTATVQYETALTKLDQSTEKLEHERVTLEGLRNEPDQRRRFWQEKYNLGESRIKQVQLAKYQLDAKIGAIDSESESAE
ncbi:hypothetical protein Cylst_6400 (plasmid) [Cylindrospermum stagnale PCC 7417]|uniref:Uncharacterized protein n=1 Tax=Cylindrospermum stagnale PCC 7417 TaxID=56107 RepID=K9X834_9NOST|nr:hypothetical protein [Cylindrospermum stagnale]AFZ28618.1 hypothetical protein Cylst_6400 [Cylindrospermum stagnale PCC 7417]